LLNSLQARRQALVAESDLHREEMALEWEAFKHEAARVATPARKAGHFLSMGAKAIGIFLALRRVWAGSRGAKGDPNGKRNWFATLVHAARVGVSLWPAFRSTMR